MATGNEIRAFIDTFAPYERAEEWDNSGFNFGRGDREVTGILVALDVTLQVLEEAIAMGVNLILTHHPALFPSLKTITDMTAKGDLLLRAAEEKIAFLCAHTNLDMAHDGINARLCNILGIKTEEEGLPFLTGEIEPTTLADFLEQVKTKLGCLGIKYRGELNREIRRVSVCSGSGCDLIGEAALKKADVLLTADAKYHDFQMAQELGLALIDAGHFETEQIICPVLVEKLRKQYPELLVRESLVHQGFYQFYS